jgi:hypothetical protein
MNEFRIYCEESPEGNPYGTPRKEITITLLVDGVEPEPIMELCIDPCALAASAAKPGNYYPATCGCGEPGCAGIWHDGIQVAHGADTIIWDVPVPYAKKKGDRSPEQSIIRWEFDTANYRAQIAEMIAYLNLLVPREAEGERFTISCHPGTLVSDLLKWIDQGFEGFKV